MENNFDGLICRLDTSEERINKLEDLSLETSQTETQKGKKGAGCPHCSGRVAQSGLDDIVTLFPDVLSYWDYERNRDIDPTKILPGSGQKAAWKCVACKHECTQIIHRRIKSPVFCPKCKNRKPI